MENKNSRTGIGCLTVVGIVFVVLKLLGVEPVAGWSWLWVLCPFWLPAAAGLLILAFVTVILLAFGRR